MSIHKFILYNHFIVKSVCVFSFLKMAINCKETRFLSFCFLTCKCQCYTPRILVTTWLVQNHYKNPISPIASHNVLWYCSSITMVQVKGRTNPNNPITPNQNNCQCFQSTIFFSRFENIWQVSELMMDKSLVGTTTLSKIQTPQKKKKKNRRKLFFLISPVFFTKNHWQWTISNTIIITGQELWTQYCF